MTGWKRQAAVSGSGWAAMLVAFFCIVAVSPSRSMLPVAIVTGVVVSMLVEAIVGAWLDRRSNHG